MKAKTNILIFLLLTLLFSSCTNLSAEQTNSQNNQTSVEPTEMYEILSGEWLISKFLGTSNIYTDEENEMDVIGKKVLITESSVFYDSEKLINEPTFTVSSITAEEILIGAKSDPYMLGMKDDLVYSEIEISDESGSNLMSLILINENELVYCRFSKYYKLIRNDI